LLCLQRGQPGDRRHQFSHQARLGDGRRYRIQGLRQCSGLHRVHLGQPGRQPGQESLVPHRGSGPRAAARSERHLVRIGGYRVLLRRADERQGRYLSHHRAWRRRQREHGPRAGKHVRSDQVRQLSRSIQVMSSRQFVAGRLSSALMGAVLTTLGGLSAPAQVPTTLSVMALVAVSSSLASAPATAATAATSSIVELSPTPPNVTQAVPPNIVVTFDDSGSMANNYMGDNRPFDNGTWSGPWRCAGLIDPRVTTAGNILSKAMNGVYYNPNVVYTPPVKADGTIFPNADATLAAVPLDAIGINRPYNPVTADTSAGYNNNPNGSTDPTGLTIMNGVINYTPKTGYYYSGTGAWDTSKNPSNWVSTGSWVYGQYPLGGSGWYATTNNKSAYANGAYPAPTAGTDRRWKCGYGSSPMDGLTTGPDGTTYPNGGPYYYRYKSTAPTITVNTYGDPDAAGLANLYTASNWEAVAVSNTTVTINGQSVNQWQNFANRDAYSRTRNLMTRTALSRVFGSLGAATDSGGFGNSIRVAWQNI